MAAIDKEGEPELTPVGNPLAAAALAWVLPGAGHFYLGRRGRGLAFTGLVFLSMLAGVWLDGRLYWPLPGQPLTFLGTLGEMGFGAAFFVLRYLADYRGEVLAPGFEYGTTFLVTAGLMNLLLVFDAWDISLGRKP